MLPTAKTTSERTLSAFEKRAKILTDRGIPVIPVRPRTKIANLLESWEGKEATNAAQIAEWGHGFPEANTAAVATAELGKVFFFEVDSPNVIERLEVETGKKIPPTMTVRSSAGKGHIYLKQTPASLSAGNIAQSSVRHADWSLRVRNQYVVGPESVRPDGSKYEIRSDVPIIEAPDWLISWCLSQKVEDKGTTVAATEAPEINEGSRNSKLASLAGSMRRAGFDQEAIESALTIHNEKYCRPALDASELATISRSVARYQPSKNNLTIGGKPPELSGPRRPSVQVTDNEEDVVVIETSATVHEDMPEAALGNGVLAEICHWNMSSFPLAYSWPAVLTVAGSMVPIVPIDVKDTSVAISSNASVLTTLYTALIGEIHSGKTQTIEHAVGHLGLPSSSYETTKAGSIEGLLSTLSKTGSGMFHPRQIMINLDEWSHFFKKANIQNASFVDVLNSGFNSTRHKLTVAGGKEIRLDAAVSIIGGMVFDKVEECFSGTSTGGFHDRFLFGVCPTQNPFEFEPFEIANAAYRDPNVSLRPVPVSIDKSVWELQKAWRKEESRFGRVLEIITRCAVIIASYDQRKTIYAKDVEAMRPLLEYQMRCRYMITPNPGATNDAKMTNAITAWLNRHAPKCEWVNQRDLKRGVCSQISTLGPQVYANSLKSLGLIGVIETQAQDNSGARASHLIRLTEPRN